MIRFMFIKLQIVLFCLAFFPALFVNAQTQDRKAEKELRKKERAEIEQALKAYTVCRFDDGLRISEVDRIQKDKTKYLARQTARDVFDKSIAEGKSEDRIFVTDDGKVYEGVTRTDGYRVMVDYGKPDFFANIRVDRSIPAEYEEDKKILIRWINFLNRERTDSETRFARETYSNGFETYTTSRTNIEKTEIGVSLFFDDKNKIAVTVYFLNQRPEFRNFKTIEEWKPLRDNFLNGYTNCINENFKNPPAVK